MAKFKRTVDNNGAVFFKRAAQGKWVKPTMGSLWRGIKRFGTWLKRILFSRVFLFMTGSLALTLLIMVIIGFIYYATIIPEISKLAESSDQPGIEMLAQDGNVISRYGQISGKYIAYRYIPQHLVDAVVATEDRRFFSHYGMDPKGVLRAMVKNMRSGRFVQGGSTITQQLAKNIFLTPERTMERKIQELMLSFWLEQKLTKQEILEMYLNRVYMGAGSYGVEAASHYYFDKSVRDIGLVESAMLAGLLKAPSRYNPTANTALATQRTKQVIINMVAANKITEIEAEQAIILLESGEKSMKKRTYDNTRYFADWVREQIPLYIDNVDQDIVVTTTLDPTWQDSAQLAIEKHMDDNARANRKVSEVALLAMKPNGAITSMIGGIDYNISQYNRATQAKRQPGSAFKPLVFLAAMESGYTPDMLMKDEKFSVGRWTPSNYDRRYRGVITLQDALADSVNTIAVKLGQYVGIGKVRMVAKRLGIKSDIDDLPSVALGSIEVTLQEMVTAYAHFSNEGRAVRPYGITEIRTKRTNKILYSRTDRDNFSDVVVVKPDDVAKMNVMLNSVLKRGTGRGARIGRSSAGKTGTTSNYKDAWFVGYTPHLVAGVWVGNDNAMATNKVTGGSIPARVWRDYMKASLANIPSKDLPYYYAQDVPDEGLPWLDNAPVTPQGVVIPVVEPVIAVDDNGDALSVDDAALPQSNVPIAKPQPAAPQPAPAPVKENSDYQLQESFWDKLMNE